MTDQLATLQSALADRYAVERELGQGGMATVYLARDLRHNRRVALKVLRPDLGALVGVERFLSEIEVTANLQHPNLLPLFDSGEAGGLLFYVMPYVEGETLRARLEREKQLPIEDAVHIATAVASALAYAHRQGVIHRDLKPENILLHDGQPLVADFGIALAVSNAGGNRITQTGLSLGTPQYMSPEQATGDRTIDGRTDVYSLGAVTYEMLVGEAPHTGTTSQAIIARVLTEKPRGVRMSRPNVPAHVAAAVERALEKLPADRWATAKDFADALTGARPVTMSPSEFSAQTVPSLAVAPRRSRMARVREAAGWALAALGIAATAYLATRQAPAPVAGRFAVELPESLATTTASAHTLALSPDGTQFAIVAHIGGQRAIHLRRLEDPAAQPVRGTEGALYPTFSPDGRWLLFVAGSALRTVPTVGGTPQTIADSAHAGRASWGDGGHVVYAFHGSIWVVSSDGGSRRLLARPDSARGITALLSPEVLPGGSYALITMQDAQGVLDSTHIGLVSLRDGQVRDLGVRGVRPQYASGHLLYARSGGLVFAAPFSLRRRKVTGAPSLVLEGVRQSTGGATAFAVAQNGTLAYETGAELELQAMYVVDRQGVERQLRSPLQAFREPRISPDGRRIAVRIGPGPIDGGLWIYDIAAGTLTRLTADSGSIRGEWTRDGTRVVYEDHAGTDSDRVVSRPWDGNGAPVVLAKAGRYGYHQISLGPPHGFSVARRGSPTGDILLAPADSLGAARPFITTPANERDPHVSPNGRLLAYTSNESGRDQIYLTPIPGPGPRVQVSVDGGTEPTWARDGSTLFYRGPVRMMVASVTERPALAVTRRDSLFVDTYRRYDYFAAYDVFPNGREFLMTKGPENRSTIYLVVNWPQLIAGRGTGAPER